MMKTKAHDIILLYLKGMLMGLADVIPGISGGTIAFITGIYYEFINSIKKIGDFLKEALEKIFKGKGKWKIIIKKINFKFFIPLILGIWSAFAIGVLFIPALLEKYPSEIMGFFAGLIIATTGVLFLEVKHKTKALYMWTIGGIIAGFLISNIPVVSTKPSYLFILLVGALAISAMILPGISGAYILLILGQYEFMLNVIKNVSQQYLYLIFFSIGAAIGLLSFSKLLNYLLKEHEPQTLMFLAGLMLGAIYSPVQKTIVASTSTQITFLIIFAIAGIILVTAIEYVKKKVTHKNLI